MQLGGRWDGALQEAGARSGGRMYIAQMYETLKI